MRCIKELCSSLCQDHHHHLLPILNLHLYLSRVSYRSLSQLFTMGFSKLNLYVVSLLLQTAASLTLPTYPGLRTDLSMAGVLEIGFNSTTSPINAWGQDFVSGLT